ncbi:MAG: hypothetical protein WCK49_08755, partial [Myxococcaceae bacterium]
MAGRFAVASDQLASQLLGHVEDKDSGELGHFLEVFNPFSRAREVQNGVFGQPAGPVSTFEWISLGIFYSGLFAGIITFMDQFTELFGFSNWFWESGSTAEFGIQSWTPIVESIVSQEPWGGVH